MTTDNETRQEILDEEHLRLLTIAYYIRAASTAFFSCFGILYVFMGIMMIVSMRFAGKPSEPSPAIIGIIFAGIGALIFILGWVFAVIQFLAGRYMSQKKHRTFCFIAAGINCMGVPYGTAIGVMTFIVLTRKSVQNKFEQGNAPGMPIS